MSRNRKAVDGRRTATEPIDKIGFGFLLTITRFGHLFDSLVGDLLQMRHGLSLKLKPKLLVIAFRYHPNPGAHFGTMQAAQLLGVEISLETNLGSS